MALPVRVWGMDASGVLFDVVTRTIDITPLGARIEGIDRPLHRGSIINVQCGKSVARFRVMWVGAPGSERHGQIGIRATEIGRYIWGKPLPRSIGDDVFEPAGGQTSDEMVNEGAETKKTPGCNVAVELNV